MDLDKRIFVIGASAGGVEALKTVVSQLPANFSGSVFIVLHLAPDYPSRLPEILWNCSRLPVRRPDNGEEILQDHIYVAIPNHHLMLEKSRVRLSSGPKENRFRDQGAGRLCHRAGSGSGRLQRDAGKRHRARPGR